MTVVVAAEIGFFYFIFKSVFAFLLIKFITTETTIVAEIGFFYVMSRFVFTFMFVTIVT